MAKGSVTIDQNICMGCGYCIEFCPQKALAIAHDQYSAQGLVVVEFKDTDNCNACGSCVSMCPHFAIEVYKIQ